ncbi:MAG: 8-hydroxy-5-deazaflavin:NADPH oxidoreductase [Actinomycetota bacterium]|nr:8-hydroxy-5-deazaflavin:NADPH oxidoreductase [Actinomycetota bacterium]
MFGPGRVGSGLARFWVDAGHEVKLAFARDQAKLEATAKEIGATAAEPTEAAAWADVVVLTTPWGVVADAIASAGDLDGKIVVDATNNFELLDASGAELVANHARGARVVKAFNTLFALTYDAIRSAKTKPDHVFCGDDPEAKAAVAQLIADVGLNPIDAGPLANAIHIENFAEFIIDLAYKQGFDPFVYRFIKPSELD